MGHPVYKCLFPSLNQTWSKQCQQLVRLPIKPPLLMINLLEFISINLCNIHQTVLTKLISQAVSYSYSLKKFFFFYSYHKLCGFSISLFEKENQLSQKLFGNLIRILVEAPLKACMSRSRCGTSVVLCKNYH